jgi:hypothetical protein
MVARVELAQYRRNLRQAAEFAAKADIVPRDATSPVAEAVRDDAMLTGQFAAALKLLDAAYRNWNRAPISNRGTALVYAHTLVVSGETQRGRELAQSTLALIDAEGAGRPHGWFCRDRATALAILGRTDEALDELALSVKLKRLMRWWYVSDLDPVFATLRTDPRFKAIVAEGQLHLAKQREAIAAKRIGKALTN